MPVRSIVIFASILFALYLYISILNPLEVSFQLYPGFHLRASLALVTILAFLAGALLVAFSDTLRDLRRTLELKGMKRRQKALWQYLEEAEEAMRRGDYASAEEELRGALKLFPDRSLLYLKLAEVLRAQGKLEEALKAVRMAEDGGEKVYLLWAEAEILRELGREGEAERALREILEVHPSNPLALRALRDLKVKGGDWEEALQLQERLLKVLPSEDGETLLALRYEKAKALGDTDRREAIRELRRLSKEASSFVPARVLWGDLLMRRGKGKAALEVWREGFEETRNPVFLERMEDYYLHASNPRGAVHMYLQILGDSPDDPVVRFLYARLCLRLGMAEEALRVLSEDEHPFSKFPPFYYLKAQAHIQREEWQRAAEAFGEGLAVEGKGISLIYRCQRCGHEEPRWLDRCPSCTRWGTFATSFPA